MFWVRTRDVQTLKIRAPDLVESYENELVQKSYKGAFCSKPLNEISDPIFPPGHDLISGQEVTLGRLLLIFFY